MSKLEFNLRTKQGGGTSVAVYNNYTAGICIARGDWTSIDMPGLSLEFDRDVPWTKQEELNHATPEEIIEAAMKAFASNITHHHLMLLRSQVKFLIEEALREGRVSMARDISILLYEGRR